MPSMMHEVLIDMVRRRPALVADLVTGCAKASVPPFVEARVVAGDFTNVVPTEYRADQVVALYGHGTDPSLGFVLEGPASGGGQDLSGEDHDHRGAAG